MAADTFACTLTSASYVQLQTTGAVSGRFAGFGEVAFEQSSATVPQTEAEVLSVRDPPLSNASHFRGRLFVG